MPFWMLWSQVHQQYKLCLNQHLQEHVLSQRVFRGNNLRQFKSRKSMRRQSALNPVRHVQRGLWAFLFEAYNPWICPVSQLICLTYGGSYSNHCSLGPEYVASTNSSLVKVSRKCLQRWMQLPGSSTPVAFFLLSLALLHCNYVFPVLVFSLDNFWALCCTPVGRVSPPQRCYSTPICRGWKLRILLHLCPPGCLTAPAMPVTTLSTPNFQSMAYSSRILLGFWWCIKISFFWSCRTTYSWYMIHESLWIQFSACCLMQQWWCRSLTKF